MQPAEIEQMIQTGLGEADVRVRDMTGTGDHFEAVVVSAAFEGKSLVQQHQLVYQTLGAAVGGAIHALALKTYTPEQWAARTGSAPGNQEQSR